MAAPSHTELERWLKRHGPLGPDAPTVPIASSAQGAWIVDDRGGRYLDLASGGTAPLGHRHPAVMSVIRAIGHRSGVEGTETVESVALMRELAELVPGGMNRRVLLCASDREAMAQAVCLCRTATNRQRVVYLSEVAGETPPIPSDAAAVVAHPLDSRLRDVRLLCDRCGAMLIDDESGLGLGTTGKMLAVESAGVRPDVYVIGRGWAAGLPFGACVTGGSALRWQHSTASDPVACAVVMESIRLVEDGMLDAATRMGGLLQEELKRFCRYAAVAAILGEGLVWTIVLSGRTDAEAIVDKCAGGGLLLKRLGKQALGVRPSLVVSGEELKQAADTLDSVLGRFSRSTS